MASALDKWTSKATRCLSKDSAAQVRSEISEHFEASRDEGVLNGATEAEAERTALIALGNAGTANRQYRDVLLTRNDARTLQEGNREARFFCANPRAWLALASLPGLALLTAAWMTYVGRADLARVLVAGGIAMSFMFVVPRLPVYTPSRSRAVRIAKWTLLAALPVVAFGRDALTYTWLFGSCWWIVGWIEWRRAVIRRKLPIEQWPKQLYL